MMVARGKEKHFIQLCKKKKEERSLNFKPTQVPNSQTRLYLSTQGQCTALVHIS